MGKEFELYQQEMDKAYKPIFARFEHYKTSANQIRLELKKYFFNVERTVKLTEPASADEKMFNFNAIKEAMEMCLADEEVLKTTNAAGLMAAFDSHISKSTLPLELQEDNCLYLFKPAKPYTPMAQLFMEQFAYALSAYRVCLGVYEVYSAVTYYKNLTADTLSEYMETIHNHTETTHNLNKLRVNNGDLIELLKEAKYTQKEIKHMLRAEKVHEGMEQLKNDINACSSMLNALLDASAIHLQNCYTKFPNNPILWMLHDRSWHQLLKTVSKHLYANQYTYSTLYGSLQIKKEFIALVKSEIDNFVNTAIEKTPLLKINRLKDAAKCIAETKIDIIANMAEKGIERVEAPKMGMFSTHKSQNFYERMFDTQKLNYNTLSIDEAFDGNYYTQ